MLGLLVGQRTFGEPVSVTGGSETTYRVVYGLVCLGLMAFCERVETFDPLV